MALFSKKAPAKKAEPKSEKPEKAEKKVKIVDGDTKEVAVVEKSAAPARKQGGIDLTMVLVRPHITEKATDLSEAGVYAFEISKRANKMDVRRAIEKYYKVKPVKIAVIVGLAKTMKNPRTGRVQVKKTAIKKALVYLKKGDKIEFV